MENIKDAILMMLAGIGITFQPNLYFGGMFLALGGVLIVRQYSDNLRETPRVLSLVTAAFLSTIAAVAAHFTAPQVPITLVMGVAGPFSVPLIKRLAQRSTELADKAIDKATGEKGQKE